MVNGQLLIVVLKWLPMVFFGVVFAIAVFLYLSRHQSNVKCQMSNVVNYKLLVISSISFRFFYAFLLTINQYYVWSQNKFTQLLLNSPLDLSMPTSGIFTKVCQWSIVNCQKSGYFLFYSFGRFWLNVFVAIGVAFAFYLFLKFLEKYQERFFEQGEIKLGFIMALIVGWPSFIVFIPCVFVFVVLMSVFRGLFLKESYTTLGWPFILAALIVFLWGDKLIQILGLGVLKI